MNTGVQFLTRSWHFLETHIFGSILYSIRNCLPTFAYDSLNNVLLEHGLVGHLFFWKFSDKIHIQTTVFFHTHTLGDVSVLVCADNVFRICSRYGEKEFDGLKLSLLLARKIMRKPMSIKQKMWNMLFENGRYTGTVSLKTELCDLMFKVTYEFLTRIYMSTSLMIRLTGYNWCAWARFYSHNIWLHNIYFQI